MNKHKWHLALEMYIMLPKAVCKSKFVMCQKQFGRLTERIIFLNFNAAVHCGYIHMLYGL
jgi:hypothetical protein